MKYVTCFAGIVMLVASSGALACASDFNCGYGQHCVKERFAARGVCMDAVDSGGTRTFDGPRRDSININDGSRSSCDSNYDCPIGFECNKNAGVCVR